MSNLDGFKEFFTGKTPQPARPYTDGEVISMYLNGKSMKVSEIAAATGRSLPEFYRILRNFNLEPNRQRNNKSQVLELHRQGYGVRKIAELTGYTSRNVRYILAKDRMND